MVFWKYWFSAVGTDVCASGTDDVHWAKLGVD